MITEQNADAAGRKFAHIERDSTKAMFAADAATRAAFPSMDWADVRNSVLHVEFMFGWASERSKIVCGGR